MRLLGSYLFKNKDILMKVFFLKSDLQSNITNFKVFLLLAISLVFENWNFSLQQKISIAS